MKMSQKILRKQEEEAAKAHDKLMAEKHARISTNIRKLIDFLSNEEFTVKETEDALQNLLKGIERVRLGRAKPLTDEISNKTFKEFNEDSEKKAEVK